MSNDQVIYMAGQIIGLASCLTEQELLEAAQTKGLVNEYREHIKLIATFRASLDRPNVPPKVAGYKSTGSEA